MVIGDTTKSCKLAIDSWQLTTHLDKYGQ